MSIKGVDEIIKKCKLYDYKYGEKVINEQVELWCQFEKFLENRINSEIKCIEIDSISNGFFIRSYSNSKGYDNKYDLYYNYSNDNKYDLRSVKSSGFKISGDKHDLQHFPDQSLVALFLKSTPAQVTDDMVFNWLDNPNRDYFCEERSVYDENQEYYDKRYKPSVKVKAKKMISKILS